MTSLLRYGFVILVFACQASSSYAQSASQLNKLNAEATKLMAARKYEQALGVVKQMIKGDEVVYGKNHLNYFISHINLASVYSELGQHQKAEELFHRYLPMIEQKNSGEPLGSALYALAKHYLDQLKYDKAEPLLQRSIKIYVRRFGGNHPATAVPTCSLGGLYYRKKKLETAEKLMSMAINALEGAFRYTDPNLATCLDSLATVYAAQGRPAKSVVSLMKRSFDIRISTQGVDHPDFAKNIKYIALSMAASGNPDEAEKAFQHAISTISEKLGPKHQDLAIIYADQARILHDAGKLQKAATAYHNSLEIMTLHFGPDHWVAAHVLLGLAELHRSENRIDTANGYAQRALAIYSAEKDSGGLIDTLTELGAISMARADWPGAIRHYDKSISTGIKRARTQISPLGQNLGDWLKSNAGKLRQSISGALQARWHMTPRQSIETISQTFIYAQWASRSDAASSITATTLRTAGGKSGLSDLVRRQQDLGIKLRKLERARTRTFSLLPEKRSIDEELKIASRLKKNQVEIADVNKRLTQEYPAYAELVFPSPLTMKDTQSLLGEKEALLLFFNADQKRRPDDKMFLWVVTKNEFRWRQLPLNTSDLTKKVKTLRAGLDKFHPDARAAIAPGQDDSAGEGLSFDLDLSHSIFKSLFGDIEDLVDGKTHLTIIPSGPLTALPFQVLVTQKPASDSRSFKDYQQASWLIRRHALAVLPSVSSLKALDQQKQRKQRPMGYYAGFGNPLLTGPLGQNHIASKYQTCNTQPTITTGRNGRAPDNITSLYKSGRGDVEVIRRLQPLPETASEICTVAKLTQTAGAKIYLGKDATEASIKDLSVRSELLNARILHFATHGLLAAETQDLLRTRAEPALVLTPPERSSSGDDGLLTASEIAELRLDTDWVIMSACNTAAGDHVGAEAFSGLASSFFYAGARSLLVSHWYVNSDATVALVTRAFGALHDNPSYDRAQAMNHAMLDMIDNGGSLAHPSNWAPFVLVGAVSRY